MKGPFQTLLLFAILLASVACDNCFYSRHLTFTHSLSDPSGNFTAVREYWMRKNTICSFVQDTNTKIEWYSSDIEAEYALSFNFQDGNGCRRIDDSDMKPYVEGKIIKMGKQDSSPGQPVPKELVCLVLFKFTNKNREHDLRLQIFNMLNSAFAIKASAIILLISLGGLSL